MTDSFRRIFEMQCPSGDELDDFVHTDACDKPNHPLYGHVHACSICYSRVAQLTRGYYRFQRIFRNLVQSKAKCLTDEQVAMYLDKSLDAREMSRAEDHLADCTACQKKVVDLHHMLDAVSDPLFDSKVAAGHGRYAEAHRHEETSPVSSRDAAGGRAKTAEG